MEPDDPHEAAERFRLTFEHALEPILIHADGVIVDANPAARRLFEADQGDGLCGLPVLELVHRDDHGRAEVRIDRMVQTRAPRPPEKFRLVSLQGRPLTAEVASVPIPYHGTTAIQVTMRDVTARHEVEAALAQSEHLWRTLVKQASDGIFVFHLEGDFVEVNVRACEMTGYAHDELLAMHPEDVIVGRADGDPEEAWRMLKDGRTLRFNRDVLRKDGSTFVAEVSVGVVGEDLVQAIIRDVTPRRRAEEALRESENKFRSLVEQSPAGIYIIQQGRFAYVNPALAAVLGRTPDELTALDELLDLVHPDDRARVAEQVDRLLEGETASMEFAARCLHRQGTVIDLEVQGTATEYRGRTAIIGTALDVTRQHQMQQARRESEHRYRNLIEQASDGIFISTFRGPLSEVNTRACEMTGYTREELYAMRFEDLLTEESARRYASQEHDLLEEALLAYEGAFRRRDGSTFAVEVAASLVDGKLVQAIVRDISGRKEHERALVAAKERAEELSSLKTAFLANISHEVRTPLTAILGLADTLAQEVSGTPRELAGLIGRSGQRLMDTLNSVLDLAQLESRSLRLRPAQLELGALVKETVELFEQQARLRGVTLAARTPTAPTVVMHDRGALNRVLSNLISNAIKFTHDGSITVTLVAGDDEATLRVEDTGIGIDDAFLPHIFDDFRQESYGLSRDYEGNGLGLAITKRLVDLMEGRIGVRSEKGRGTTFTVVLPLSHLEEAAPLP